MKLATHLAVRPELMDAKEVAQWNKSADTYNNLSHATDIYQIVHKTIFL